jgi:hypothetical protein
MWYHIVTWKLTDENWTINPNAEIKASILVTNDGRTFSNALDFTYIAGTHFNFNILI